MVLSGKGSGCLTEGRNDVIGEIFEIHGDGAAGNSGFAEAVDRCLHKNVGKAENSALECGRKAYF